MAVSNYGGGQMPGMQVSAPVTPVNEQLISSVGTLGKIAIAQRESENKAVNQQFLSEAQQYFSNVETEIEADPIRAQALDFANLSVSSNLNPEQQARLAKYKADFKYLDRAESQGKLSRLNKLTRAQAMLTKALADRPDLGDELRNLATDTLGADVTKASTLLFGEAMAMAKAEEGSVSNQVKSSMTRANDLVQYAPDQARAVMLIADAAKKDAAGDSEGAMASLNQFFTMMQSPEGQAATLAAEADASVNKMNFILLDGSFDNQLLSTDPQISSAAKAALDTELSGINTKITQLSAFSGVAADKVKPQLERLIAARAVLETKARNYGNPSAINSQRENQRVLYENSAPVTTQNSVAIIQRDGSVLEPKATATFSQVGKAVYNMETNRMGISRTSYSMPISGWHFVELFRTEKRGDSDAVKQALDLAADQMKYFYMMKDESGTPLMLDAVATRSFLQELNRATPNIVSQANSALSKEELEYLKYHYRAINDRTVALIVRKLPPEYAKDVKVPNSAGSTWSASNRIAKYTGNDMEGFRKAWTETAQSLDLIQPLNTLRQYTDAIHGLQSRNIGEE